MDNLNTYILRGKYAWTSWLSVMAASSLILLLMANISDSNSLLLQTKFLSLKACLTAREILVLFLLSPLFFTRLSKIFSLLVMAYLLLSVHTGRNITTSFCAGEKMMLIQLAILAALSERMPWRSSGLNQRNTGVINEVILQGLFLLSFIGGAYSIAHLASFANFLSNKLNLVMSHDSLKLIILIYLMTILTASLRIHRGFLLIFATIPSVLVTSYTWQLSADQLLVPFVLALALILSQFDSFSSRV